MAKILREANRLLLLWRKFGPNAKKIDLDIFFSELVLPASAGDIGKIHRDSFDSFEGLMYRPDPQRRVWIVGINSKISYLPRQNFTLAHEIGHFIAHRYLRERFECNFDSINDFEVEPFEREANEFAAHLLMPPDVMRSFDERPFTAQSITEVSQLLGVSRLAAAMRWVMISSRHIGFCKSRDGIIINGRASNAAFKKGLFFRGGDELPALSRASLLNDDLSTASWVAEGVWCGKYPVIESAHLTSQGNYIYSFIDMGKI